MSDQEDQPQQDQEDQEDRTYESAFRPNHDNVVSGESANVVAEDKSDPGDRTPEPEPEPQPEPAEEQEG
jgi:hypothetical protein